MKHISAKHSQPHSCTFHASTRIATDNRCPGYSESHKYPDPPPFAQTHRYHSSGILSVPTTKP
ncbi:hypothetical protein CANTEDRAFT_114340 [Yamadazyma tenuis ATCC 10573]|uniref:Uncharacterized protein n=1 Tax=Candida tenuis (strain ATCC 10573 / BCRC 21748 / CBS 615 / JCM 9827 / NBRC 10315 / NRRL Y-1498 / VKM Y-70) TaxID=590646 RepID=G3B6W3_CANTC|nr:uncharacterized protein CANTEDRAFT_114340 [Yamadazyma tenuis ATCC 10573]EGV63037.1 hypothetical protein CANTEDRAFT_114340 [Yamadazyma tenuis ATCC 10573]